MKIQDIGLSKGFSLKPLDDNDSLKLESDFSDMFGINGNTQGAVAGGIPSGVANGSGVINGNLIVNGTIGARQLVVGEQSWISDVAFSTSAYNVVSWTSGSVLFKDGTSESVSSGTTGALGDTNKRYIYADFALSNDLYVSSNSSVITGNRILLATVTAQSSDSKGAIIQTNFADGTTIAGDKISTGIITSADGSTYFDLENNKIVMNDGTNDRLFIGKV